jgi:hypothetical protein
VRFKEGGGDSIRDGAQRTASGGAARPPSTPLLFLLLLRLTSVLTLDFPLLKRWARRADFLVSKAALRAYLLPILRYAHRMFRLFADVAILAARRAARSWLAALSIPIYALLFLGAVRLLGPLLAPLGMIGGFVLGFIGAACFGGYLSLLASSVAGTRIKLADLRHGLRAVWDVLGAFFALWIIGIGVGVLQRMAGPNGPAVLGVASLALAIFANVLPELIYNSRSRSFAMLKESASFVMANPFAWFAPNLIFAFVILWATGSLSFSSPGALLVQLSALGSIGGILQIIEGAPLWMAPLLIAFVHYVMVFRGLLFQELSAGSTRMRAFRRHMGT